jgi:hypothetical protein
MAGHSKFKNIMHRKGAQDKKRSGMFSKLSREITVAAKMGLPDPDMNPRLRAAVNAAKAQSMPKDNIQRSIDKASKGDAENYEEIRYEGFGPGGVSADRRDADRQPQPHRHQRAHRDQQEWRQSRRAGLGQPCLRSHGPDQLSRQRRRRRQGVRSRARSRRRGRDLERGRPRDLDRAGRPPRSRQGAEPGARRAEGAKLAWRPQTMVEVDEGDAATLFKLIDALDDDDDVQTVWGNYEVSDEVMEKLGLH